MKRVNVARADSIPDRGRMVIEVDGLEIGIFRLDDAYFAYESVCPHMGGPVCQGRIMPKVEEVVDADRKSHGMRFSQGDINIVCPWHGYEFDIRSGRHQGNPKLRLRRLPVECSAGHIVLEVPDRRGTGSDSRQETVE